MSLRSAIITCAAVTALGIAGLVVAGAADQRSTAFSADVPTAGPQVVLRSGQQACESPVYASASFGSVTAWVVSKSGPGATLEMRVRSLHGATLAAGRTPVGSAGSTPRTFRLTRVVAAGQAVVVCFRSTGPKPAQVLGSSGRFSLLFLRPHPISLLSSLPAIFARASLFRPTWMGAWAFWALLALLLVGFAVGGVAITQAVRADLEAEGNAGLEP